MVTSVGKQNNYAICCDVFKILNEKPWKTYGYILKNELILFSYNNTTSDSYVPLFSKLIGILIIWKDFCIYIFVVSVHYLLLNELSTVFCAYASTP